jgi:uroporphyrinogen-III synthase
MTRRVLVTRPEPGASATASALRRAGFDPVIASLTAILPLPVDDAFNIDAIDAVAATSANALRHAPERLLVRLAGLPLFTVGEATTAIARKAGFRSITTGNGDAADLVDSLLASIPTRSTVLYLCGKVRRPDFERALGAGGPKTVLLETYDTQRRDVVDAARQLLGSGSRFHAVLIHSSEAAVALADVLARPEVAGLLDEAMLVAISARAATPVEALFGRRIVIAPQPNDAAMVSMLTTAS